VRLSEKKYITEQEKNGHRCKGSTSGSREDEEALS
jgi:hypothetical protein